MKIFSPKESTNTLTDASFSSLDNDANTLSTPDEKALAKPASSTETSSIEIKNVESTNGETTPLGYGYATSKAISERGYRDGASVQTRDDMDKGIELVLAEYETWIENKILQDLKDKIEKEYEEIDRCNRILSRSGNISQQYDAQYEKIITSCDRRIVKIKQDIEDVKNGKDRQARAIKLAYERGYSAGVGRSANRYRKTNDELESRFGDGSK